ncbi:MAG: dienelactone hydrolase family protein [Chloroflexota bacterium]|nr:dienelactone hydrolase family protein [Chloroflexota bacterium]
MQATTPAGIAADNSVEVALLRANHPDCAVIVVGFCFGGSNSWLYAASGHRLAGEIGFRDRPMADALHGPASASSVAEITCPLHDLFDGADPLIPPETIAEWDSILPTCGVSRGIVI